MSKTLNGYLSELHRTQSQGAFVVPHEHILAIKAEVDAREAELVAEVEKYREALGRIVENAETTMDNHAYALFVVSIARNALGED